MLTKGKEAYWESGFQAYGTEPRAIGYGGRAYSEILMARELDKD
jgi:hypothetical protein